ncbi:MAG: hypothetical protein ABJA70_22315 [Chryseolinea sp.]
MKAIIAIILTAASTMMSFDSKPIQGENVEFSCVKVNKATNTCHFNFIVDGAKYRFVDLGCKWNKKREEVIKKAKAGTLALAKDWKVECDPKASGK